MILFHEDSHLIDLEMFKKTGVNITAFRLIATPDRHATTESSDIGNISVSSGEECYNYTIQLFSDQNIIIQRLQSV